MKSNDLYELHEMLKLHDFAHAVSHTDRLSNYYCECGKIARNGCEFDPREQHRCGRAYIKTMRKNIPPEMFERIMRLYEFTH